MLVCVFGTLTCCKLITHSVTTNLSDYNTLIPTYQHAVDWSNYNNHPVYNNIHVQDTEKGNKQ